MTLTKTPLPWLLDEFRTALQDEIEVAKRSASYSAIPLSNGHKIGQQGNAYQYAFLIDTVLNIPDGAPGDLIVPGKAPIQTTIVSVEGLRILISVETDLGAFVPIASLQSNLTFLMRKLIERIENNVSASNPAASRMLGKESPSGSPRKPPDSPPLNESQMLALESALGRDLTVIWGPPGTGKTHTIGTITEHLHKSERTVLIVSHTNTAVDQAIKHVAKSMQEHLERGVVIRVGEVRDEVLKSDYPDVLLRRQVERQSSELLERRDALSLQKQSLNDELSDVREQIALLEWIGRAQDRIQSRENDLRQLHEDENQLKKDSDALEALQQNQARISKLCELQKRASKILGIRDSLKIQGQQEQKLVDESHRLNLKIHQANRQIVQQAERIKTAEDITPLRQKSATFPSVSFQKSNIQILTSSRVKAEHALQDRESQLEEANALLKKGLNMGGWSRYWNSVPNPQIQQDVATDLEKKVANLKVLFDAAVQACKGAETKLSHILQLDAELSHYTDIGTYSYEVDKKDRFLRNLQDCKARKTEIETDLKRLSSRKAELELEEKQLSANLGGDASEIYSRVREELEGLKRLEDSTKYLTSKIIKQAQSIRSALEGLLSELPEFQGVKDFSQSLDELLNLAQETHRRLATTLSRSDLPGLLEKTNTLPSEIKKLSSDIEAIGDELAQVERNVIANAKVVGATLTKTYLSDDIQARKFDTVILDEASMAPIPALWVAALLSEKNLIIVGDFKQLPPIVLSKKELTKKWLGRDIFEVSGLKDLCENNRPPAHFIILKEQRRMLADIARVANQFYDGLLSTPDQLPHGLDELSTWYNSDWPHDCPVLLIDTGSLNAWVTSVVKNNNPSRLNFLSATVAVDLAEQLLKPDRPKHTEGEPRRILIVAPYRAHAKLVSVLLRENEKLQDEAIAGTVHSFQGSEADVVIFDLVVDEPHWRVNLFYDKIDDQIKRLLNVGLTRAKFRLFILGDFSYCQKTGKKAFLGKSLLPFLLKSFPRVEASQIVPNGLAARAAKAQMTMLGGEIEPDSERIVVTQEHFFRLLLTDFSKTNNRIVIYSPFMAEDRFSKLMPQFQAAVSRGIAIFIITKSHSERSKSEKNQYRSMEAQLRGIGVIVRHKMGMHEKLVFIDDDILWSGSLNPLSFSNTQEVMERRKSKAVFDDYFQTLRLQELLAVCGTVEDICPICKSEIVASEGPNEPYYWRCVNKGCYTRSIDQPYALDGVLSCRTCGASFQFWYRGDYPHWRCTTNKYHHQKVHKAHLRLPKMAALIPDKERPKVCAIFGIDNFDAYFGRSSKG